MNQEITITVSHKTKVLTTIFLICMIACNLIPSIFIWDVVNNDQIKTRLLKTITELSDFKLKVFCYSILLSTVIIISLSTHRIIKMWNLHK